MPSRKYSPLRMFVLAKISNPGPVLSDSETKAIFRHPPAELALVRDFCRLSEREKAIVASLPKGSALWKVGNRSFQVEHLLSAGSGDYVDG
jgi:hypothetical protein